MSQHKLFLCGFSGAGKTTLGDKLSKSAEFQVLDLDEEIFNRMGSGHDHLGEYIEEIGLEEFRRDEIDMLRLLDQNFKENYLIILGGGALETEQVRDFIKSVDGTLIHLKASFDECWKRLKSTGDRPLVKKGQDFMSQLFEDRQKLYNEAKLELSQEQAGEIQSIEDLIKLL
jgi:shikimate kinase